MAIMSWQICILAFSASLLISSSCSHGDLGLPKMPIALFIFGDSIFDVGNNNYINTTTSYQSNFMPYGETFFRSPTGRFSDGRLIPDFIAEYANLPFVKPYLQPGFNNYTDGVNFASAGAGALPETRQGFVIDLKTQLKHFKKVVKNLRQELGNAEAKTFLSKAAYLISIGSNDYFFPFTTNSSLFESHSHKEYVAMVIGNLKNVIKEIYKKGGRKFGVPSLTPLGCLPGARALNPENTSACVEEIIELVILHNRALDKALLKLKTYLHGLKYSIPNFYQYIYERINKPSTYGFKEGKTACSGSGPNRGINTCGGKRGVTMFELCENVTEYVFFDSGHPTERVYQQVSKLWWSHRPNVTGPYINLKQLFDL